MSVSDPAARVRPAATSSSGLQIVVSAGVGQASTTLAAFDVALQRAGIANFNLITLSSVIPPGSVIEVPDSPRAVDGVWGDRLYVVLADARAEKHNEEAWAGIGWTQDPATGRGVFVEHHGFSEHQVEADIHASLESLVERRPDVEFGPMNSVVRGIVCESEPVCALVAATFVSVPWPKSDVVDIR